jgi:putative effector of murein hydrolase
MTATQLTAFHTLLWFTVSIGAYLLGTYLQKISRNHSLISPPIVAIAVLIIILKVFDVEYVQYMLGGSIIGLILKLSTVALAIPLFKNKYLITRNALPIFIAIFISAALSALLAYYLSNYLNADKVIQLSIMTKSVTTPIALLVSDKIGAAPSLCIMFIFTTGILGGIFGLPILSLFKLKNDRATGLALGVICHGLGAARAFQKSEICGLFAMVGMSIMGVVSGIMIPLMVKYIL